MTFINKITISNIDLEDIDELMKLKKEAGWNQTEKDWQVLIKQNPEYCLKGTINNKIIATVTSFNYEKKLAWIGMMIVKKEFRGRGISQLLMKNVLEKLHDFSSVKLDATPEGRYVYKKFEFLDEYVIRRMTTDHLNVSGGNKINGIVLPIFEDHIPEILDYDYHIMKFDRSLLLNHLIKTSSEDNYQLIRDNKICGYILSRPGSKKEYIGPLIADSEADAKALLLETLKNKKYQNSNNLLLDVLENKKDYIHFLKSLGFTEQRQFIRMFRKTNPYPGSIKNLYFICGPEFG